MAHLKILYENNVCRRSLFATDFSRRSQISVSRRGLYTDTFLAKRAHVCKYTCTHPHTKRHPDRLPFFLGVCFLFTPFPPLFTRGDSCASLVPPLPLRWLPILPLRRNRAQPRGWHTQGRIKRSRHPRRRSLLRTGQWD